MLSTQLLKNHFTDPNITQIRENSFVSNALGFGGLSLIGTAAIASLFFTLKPQIALALMASGAGLFASHLTGKDGYAWLVVSIAAAAILAKTLDSMYSQRQYIKIDITDLVNMLELDFMSEA